MKSGILILKQVRTGKPNQIAFELTDEAYTRDKALKFFKAKVEREAKRGKEYPIEAELEIHYQQRTMAQNRLLRSLERIMAFEQDGTEDTYDEYHEGLIEKYCPKSDNPNPITGRLRRKRTSELNTVEMAQVIGGAFYELATMGVELSSSNIVNYWIEWFNWRGKQGADPFTSKARTLDEYRHDVPVCEACLKGLVSTDEYGKDHYAGQLAHMVSKGSGGSDEVWNLIHLCTECHLFLQHQQGWAKLIGRYPHISWRVAQARMKLGSVEEIKDDPEMEPVMKEVEKIQNGKVESIKEVFGGEEVSEDEELEIF